MMATAHVAETSVINCLFQDNLNPEDHPSLNVSAPGFKPFNAKHNCCSLKPRHATRSVNFKKVLLNLVLMSYHFL